MIGWRRALVLLEILLLLLRWDAGVQNLVPTSPGTEIGSDVDDVDRERGDFFLLWGSVV